MTQVGLIQMHSSPDPDQNMEKAIAKIREAAARGAQIICLPELFRTTYFCQTEDTALFPLAEPIPGPTTDTLSVLAKQLQVVLIVSLFERRAPGVYHNTAAVIDADGCLCGIYRKMHIPDDPLYYEKFYFAPGDLGFRVFDTRYGRIGVLICWDQWYPEAARLLSLQGAGIIFCPTSIGWAGGGTLPDEPQQRIAWRTVQVGSAIANGVYLAAVNRVGADSQLTFWGSSFLCGPMGEDLASAGAEQEEILIGGYSEATLEKTRQEWPFLRDRRIDAYDALNQRWHK